MDPSKTLPVDVAAAIAGLGEEVEESGIRNPMELLPRFTNLNCFD